MKQKFEIRRSWQKSAWKLLLILPILLTSCYKDVPGCNDPLAVNYSFVYDIPCDDGCCQYPSAIINWVHTYGGDNYRLNNLYGNAFNDSFAILDQKIYFGSVAYEGFNGPISFLEKTSYTKTNGESTDVLNDFFILKKTLTTSKFSMLKYAGKISGIGFNTRLEDEANDINSSALISSSPLSNNENMRNADGEFYSAYFKIAHGVNLSDTTNYYLNTSAPSKVDYMDGDTIIQGQNIEVTVQINYAQLFDQIDFENATSSAVTVKLEETLPTIFSEVQ